MITILNTSIITDHGTFSYKPCSLEQAKELISGGFQSAVGHESAAKVISIILGADVKVRRVEYQQQSGDTALVFKLNGRPPEGKILSEEEIEEIGYEWGILERFDDQIILPASEDEIKPSIGKRVWWWLRDKYWWIVDHVIMPLICFLLAVGFVAAAANGLKELLSQLF